MNRNTLLTITTLALGASSIWLAIELHGARQELDELRVRPSLTTSTPAASAGLAEMASPDVETKPVAEFPAQSHADRPRDSTQAHGDAAMHAATLANNFWVRTWLNDPAKRAKLLADSRKVNQRDVPRDLMDLGDADYDRLLDILAASGMRYAEAMYRCNTDPACDLQAAVRTQMQANRRELVDLLGEVKTQLLENYRDNYLERNSVDTFRSDLPDSMPLSDAQAETLANALGEERRQIVKEWHDRGEETGGLGNRWGWLTFPRTKDLALRVAEATEFQRRQRDRAAEFLTSAQLEIFTKQQEQMLEIARGSWEYEEQAGWSQ